MQDPFVIPDNISIHAPREGGDEHARPEGDRPADFNPRPPARGATGVTYYNDVPNVISIHAPARGATGLANHPALRFVISIHAPTRGAT